MSKFWPSGSQITHRGIVHQKVWIAKPMTVVADTLEQTILLLVPGTLCKFPTNLIERKYSGLNPTVPSRWEVQDHSIGTTQDWVWREKRVLLFMRPDEFFAVYIVWDHATNDFLGWYVNFELPFTRTAIGFDTLDLELDLVVNPDGSYFWKDEAEFQDGVRRGSIAADVVDALEAAREVVLERLKKQVSPFDGQWLQWMPDRIWGIPQLHPDWERVM